MMILVIIITIITLILIVVVVVVVVMVMVMVIVMVIVIAIIEPLGNLVELNIFNTSFSSLSSHRNWTNSSLSSDSRQQCLSQRYPPR